MLDSALAVVEAAVQTMLQKSDTPAQQEEMAAAVVEAAAFTSLLVELPLLVLQETSLELLEMAEAADRFREQVGVAVGHYR